MCARCRSGERRSPEKHSIDEGYSDQKFRLQNIQT